MIKDEYEQEIEFNFDIQRLRDENELELEVITKLIYEKKSVSVKQIPLLVRLGGHSV